MLCPSCGNSIYSGAKFCHHCGCRLQPPIQYEMPTPPAPAVPPVTPPVAPPAPPVAPPVVPPVAPPPVKKGSHWVPILIMTILVIVGTVLFFMTSTAGSKPQDPTEAEATDSTVSETPWFRNEDGTLYFDPALYTGPEELEIPEKVDGRYVTSIAEDCFAGNDFLTTIILPDTLEEIGDGAFSGCSVLRGIFIPEGVERIGAGAFRDCVNLEAICVPGSVDVIGYSAFRGCVELKYVLYSGKYSDWIALYSSHIASGTQIYCTDGTFLQGVNVP